MIFSFSEAQDIIYENLLNTKWRLKNYIIDGQSFPVEKKRRKDYYIFKENNSRDEIMHNLADYLMKFENFCFDLDVNIMLNGSIDFKYR